MPSAHPEFADSQFLRECSILPASNIRLIDPSTDDFWTLIHGGHEHEPFDSTKREKCYAQLSETLRSLLSNQGPQTSLAEAESLQWIARYALRLGAWQLLSRCIGRLLSWVRSWLPTPYRLSLVTGLVAEWALASGNGKIAIIYASESFAWGSEPHRIRSYLAYAHLLMGSPRECRDELNFVLSHAATTQLPELSGRRPFTSLHEYRLTLLRQETWPQESFANLLKKCLDVESPLIVPQLALLADWAMFQSSNIALFPSSVIQLFVQQGRWRDLRLAELSSCNQLFLLTGDQHAWINKLDELAESLVWPEPSIVDRHYIDQLPTTILDDDPFFARRRMLCCI